MPRTFNAAASIASACVGKASEELIDTPFGEGTVAWKPLPFGVALNVTWPMPRFLAAIISACSIGIDTVSAYQDPRGGNLLSAADSRGHKPHHPLQAQ